MYVTQTFLGLVANDAKLYVYFLTEGYKGAGQQHIYEEVTKRVADFGLSTGKEVAVVMPHAGSEGDAFREISRSTDDELQQFYRHHIDGETPGLLVTLLPLNVRHAFRGAMFFSLAHLVHPLRESRRIVSNVKEATRDDRFRSALRSMNKFIKLEPNLFGLGFNLNKAIEAILEQDSK